MDSILIDEKEQEKEQMQDHGNFQTFNIPTVQHQIEEQQEVPEPNENMGLALSNKMQTEQAPPSTLRDKSMYTLPNSKKVSGFALSPLSPSHDYRGGVSGEGLHISNNDIMTENASPGYGDTEHGSPSPEPTVRNAEKAPNENARVDKEAIPSNVVDVLCQMHNGNNRIMDMYRGIKSEIEKNQQ